jgi:hypothetical protein
MTRPPGGPPVQQHNGRLAGVERRGGGLERVARRRVAGITCRGGGVACCNMVDRGWLPRFCRDAAGPRARCAAGGAQDGGKARERKGSEEGALRPCRGRWKQKVHLVMAMAGTAACIYPSERAGGDAEGAARRGQGGDVLGAAGVVWL